LTGEAKNPSNWAMFKSLFLILAFVGFASAQTVEILRDKVFTSTEGRFSVALPNDSVEFEEVKPDADAPKQSGGKYTWSLPEGVITIDYTDDPDSVIKTKVDFAGLEEGVLAGVAVFGGKPLLKKRVYLDGNRGYQVNFVDKDKMTGVTRMLIVGERKYTLFGLARKEVKGSAAFITKAIESFRLLKSK
jgi:hypothetical protein